jgi:hypothetical protein
MNKTPKEKAKELFNQYHNLIQDIGGDMGHEILVSILAQKCALIAVKQILDNDLNSEVYFYWKEVKEEINNL